MTDKVAEMLDALDAMLRTERDWWTDARKKPFVASVFDTCVRVLPLEGTSGLRVVIEWEDLERDFYAALPALKANRRLRAEDLPASRHASYSIAFALASWDAIHHR